MLLSCNVDDMPFVDWLSVKIGFFVDFGFVQDGVILSVCCGFGFVIKFGCVVTCHWLVCCDDCVFQRPIQQMFYNKIIIFYK